MADLPAETQALEALRHLLRQLRERPEIAWYIGPGSQTWALVTEAYATLSKKTVKEVRKNAVNPQACDPRRGYDDLLDAAKRVMAQVDKGEFELSLETIGACSLAVKAAEGRDE